MEVSKKQQLEIWLDHTYWIWFYARLYYSYFVHLHDNRNSHNNSLHTPAIRYACFAMLISECSKLFSDSSGQKYNFFRLVETLKPGGKFQKLIKVPPEKLLWLETKLTEHNVTIEHIESLHNKSYAHSDIVEVPALDRRFKEDLLSLLDIGYEIIRSIGTSTIGKDYYYGDVHYDLRDFSVQ